MAHRAYYWWDLSSIQEKIIKITQLFAYIIGLPESQGNSLSIT